MTRSSTSRTSRSAARATRCISASRAACASAAPVKSKLRNWFASRFQCRLVRFLPSLSLSPCAGGSV
eukprot:scaffold18273_cov50-Phaeocystis_antarctica.AAC.1